MLRPILASMPLALSVALASGLSIIWPAAAQAQDPSVPCRLCATSPDSAGDAPATPLRLEVQTRLEFDKVVVGGLGEARFGLSPSGSATLSGAASAAGARAMPGSVIIRGEPGKAVRVAMPRTVHLYGDDSRSLEIRSILTDLPDFPKIDDDGTLSFRFGGELTLNGDSDGAYRGSVEIIVEYL